MILDLFYPRTCLVCSDVLPYGETGTCSLCSRKLAFVQEPCCMKCGKELVPEPEDPRIGAELCRDCRKRKRSFEGGIALLNYNDAARKIMADLKYNNLRQSVDYLAEEICRRYGNRIRALNAAFLVPVPIHRKKRRMRGYNQAGLLAREIGKRLGIPVLKDAIIRTENTAAQKKLNALERRKNEQKAFRAAKDLSGIGTLILIDDIYTTGSTAEACTRALISAGADRVFLLNACIGIQK